MPLYLVIGYTSKKIDAGSAKVLYSGPDGGESKAILATANQDFPVRERYVRPYPNGGRKIDAAPAPAAPSADTSAVAPAEAEASAQADPPDQPDQSAEDPADSSAEASAKAEDAPKAKKK
jgi:hypothetical protein